MPPPDVAGHEPDLVSIRFKLKILAWLATTTTGDRSEIYLAGEEEQLWRRVASDVDRLPRPGVRQLAQRALPHGGSPPQRRRCSHCCHEPCAPARRHRASGSGARARTTRWSIDEAHQLESVATEQLGVSGAPRGSDAHPRSPAGAARHAARRRISSDAARRGSDCSATPRDSCPRSSAVSTPPTGGSVCPRRIRGDPGFGFVERSAVHAAGVLQRDRQRARLGHRRRAMQTELLPQPDRARRRARARGRGADRARGSDRPRDRRPARGHGQLDRDARRAG